MNKLLFFTNQLQNPSMQKQLNIPLEFIVFGIVKGRMYKHFRSNDSFIIPINTHRRWGNSVIYGSVFLCKDFDFYSRILDAYQMCSMSTMLRNHNRDIHHRVEVNVTPIYFDSIDDLSRLKYKEGEEIQAQTYIGNINHPKIIKRINQKKNSYRITDGIGTRTF